MTAFRQWLSDNPDKLADNGGGYDVSATSAFGYDAYMAVIEAVQKAGGTGPADILAGLPGTTVSGATGVVTLTSAGAAKRDGACILSADTSDVSWRYVTYQKAN